MILETTLRLGFSLATFGTMVAWEYARPRRDLIEPRRRRWPANLSLAVLNAMLVRVFAGGAVVSAAIFAADRGAGMAHWLSVPGWAAWIVTVLALDFAVYLQHVMFHAVPVFWRLHRVHHADLGFDTTTGLRFHPIEILLSAGLKSAVVVLVGGVPAAVVAFEILLNASSLFNHGNVVLRESLDRSLRWLIVTPDMHRIHHSTRVAETNSNFGFSFSCWDRLGGTYRREPLSGQLGLEIGLSEYRRVLNLGQLLLLPFRSEPAPVPPNAIEPDDLYERLSKPDPPTVLDVRKPAELRGPLGRLEGAVNIPLEELTRRLDDLTSSSGRLVVPV